MMKHERVLDAEYRGLPPGPLPSEAAAKAGGPTMRHGYGEEAGKARSLALTLTVAVHVAVLGVAIVKWGNGDHSAAPAATSIATFNVGPSPSEPAAVPEPPEPVAAQPDVAQRAFEAPEIIMPAIIERQPPASEQAADKKPAPPERTQPPETPSPPERTARTDTKAPAKAEASAPAKASREESDAYGRQVMQHLSRYRRPNAIGPGATKVKFTVSADGALSSASIARSSGSTRFDREALAMVRRAAPFPKPPPGVNRAFSVEVEGQ